MPKADVGLMYDIVDLGELEDSNNFIHGINNEGLHVGSALNPSTGRVEAFMADDGHKKMLGTLGGSFSAAFGINNAGVIVGGSLQEGDETFHAFIRYDDKLLDLNHVLAADARWELIQALGINDRGQVLGFGAFEGRLHMFLLLPNGVGTRDTR